MDEEIKREMKLAYNIHVLIEALERHQYTQEEIIKEMLKTSITVLMSNSNKPNLLKFFDRLKDSLEFVDELYSDLIEYANEFK